MLKVVSVNIVVVNVVTVAKPVFGFGHAMISRSSAAATAEPRIKSVARRLNSGAMMSMLL